MMSGKIGKFLVGAVLIFSLLPNAALAEEAALAEGKEIFSDVTEGHPNFVAIDWLKQNKIINGYMDGSFQPDKKVNRAEALKMIFKCLNIKTENVPEQQAFPDVPNESWFAKYVKKAKELGVVGGYEDGYFRPENKINRAEALKIIFEILGEKSEPEEDPYNDVPRDAWFARYAETAKEKTILSVNLSGNIHPEEYLTRGDIAELIYRTKKSGEGYKFGKITFYSNHFNGKKTAFGEIFDQNAKTAAHLTLPLNTMVRVTNLENGKEVDVRINDRGPFTRGRVLDLSRYAFEQIAHPGSGYVPAQYKIIDAP